MARVFRALCDGGFHSGEELATLGVSRNAVWKAAAALRAAGARIDAVRNKGYRLPWTVDALDSLTIREHLSRTTATRLSSVEVVWTTGSTNTDLRSRPRPPPGRGEVLLAELQTAGRGRRERQWFAPPGGSLPLSLSWSFESVVSHVTGLSIAVGVCAARALMAMGVSAVKLKWPTISWLTNVSSVAF